MPFGQVEVGHKNFADAKLDVLIALMKMSELNQKHA